MNDLSQDDRLAIGGNNPPADLLLGELLRDKLIADNAALLSRRDQLLGSASRAPLITDDEVAGRVTDFIRQIAACAKAADTARVGAKEPFLQGGREVDGFFKGIGDPLLGAKKRIEGSLTDYLRQKAEKERREREERERQARAEAARRQREADEAAAKMRQEQDLAEAVNRQRVADQAEADHVKAERDATAKAADMSRTRGEYGAVSSLRTFWTFADLDRASLDLETLRQHLPLDALEKAVRSFIKAGGRELSGVRIFEDTAATVR